MSRAAAALTLAPLLVTISAPLFSAETVAMRMIEAEGEARTFWPGWRGPTRQGVVLDSGYPDRWGPDQNVVWKVAVPGSGNSSPIVWGGLIFLSTSYEGGKTRSLMAFDRSNGRQLWERKFVDDGPERVYPKNGHASGTPVTDGERIYVFLGSGGLAAVDFDGKVVWTQALGEPSNYHGTAGSPLLYGDSVVIFQDQATESFVAAYSRESGEPLWRTARDTRVGWGSPIAVRVGDRDQIVVSSQKFVTGYDASSGAEVWRASGNLFEVIPTPVVAHDLIFASSGRAGPTLAIRGGGRGDVTDSHIVWTSPKGSPFVPSGVVVGDNLYLVNDMASIATCFRAKTGEPLWQGRLGKAARESFSASPVAVDGKVFFTNDDGEVFVLAAGDEFKLLHVNRFDERTLASPALVDGSWYWRTAQHLWAIAD